MAWEMTLGTGPLTLIGSVFVASPANPTPGVPATVPLPSSGPVGACPAALRLHLDRPSEAFYVLGGVAVHPAHGPRPLK